MPPNQANKVGEAFIEITGKVNVGPAVSDAGNKIKNDLKPAVDSTGEAFDRMGSKAESSFRRIANSIRTGLGGGFYNAASGIANLAGGAFGISRAEIGGSAPTTAQGLAAGFGRLGMLGGIGTIAGVAISEGINQIANARARLESNNLDAYLGTARRGRDIQEALSDRVAGFENTYRVRDAIRAQATELQAERDRLSQYLQTTGGSYAGLAQKIGTVSEYFGVTNLAELVGIETPELLTRRLNQSERRQAINARRILEAQQLDFNDRVGASVIGAFDSVNGQTIGPGQTADAAFADLVKLTRSMLEELKAMRRNN